MRRPPGRALFLGMAMLACVVAHPAAAQYCCEYEASCFDASSAGDPLCGEFQGTIIAGAECDYGTGNCAPAGPGECSGTGPDPACDDGDVCTADVCVDGTCQHLPELCQVELYKVGSPIFWSPDDGRISYRLTVETNLVGASVVLWEIVPVATSFLPADSTPGWSCSPDAGAGATCTFPVGELGPFSDRRVDFVVQVSEGADPRFDILNEASITGPGIPDTTDTEVTYSPIFEPCEDAEFFCTFLDHCLGQEGYSGLGICLARVFSLLTLDCPPETTARAIRAVGPSGVDLLLLYRLRDRVLAGTAAGRRATELYYEFTGRLVAAASRSNDVLRTGLAALAAWTPVMQALVDGRGDEVDVTREQVKRFEEFLAALRAVADPDLLAALEREVMLVDPSSFVRLSAAELLARLERLSFEVASALDPFHCYGVKPTRGVPRFQPVTGVEVAAPGFGETIRFDVRKPRHLCVPADEHGRGVGDAATHLERYEIRAARGEPRHLRQRGLKVATVLGMLTLDTVKPTHLMVPTATDPASPPPAPAPGGHEVDHYGCYAVKVARGAAKLARRVGVIIGDPLGEPARRYLVKKPTQLCVPVAKNGEAVKHPTDHLLCYRVKAVRRRCDATAPVSPLGACAKEADCGGVRGQTSLCGRQARHTRVRGLHASNQFGAETLDVVAEHEVCLPALRF